MPKRRELKPVSFTTVGVRFDGDPSKVWTYKIRRNHKVVRGDALVVTNDRGSSVCFVVRVDPKPVLNPNIVYKFITQRVAKL